MQITEATSRTQVTSEVLDVLMNVGRRFRRRDAATTIDPGSFWLLRSLAGDGPVRITELAAATGLDASTVSRHLTALHRAGLVERAPDPDDRRARRVQVSAAGRLELDEALAQRRALLERSLSDWSDDEVEQLHLMTTRMLAGLESATEGTESHDR